MGSEKGKEKEEKNPAQAVMEALAREKAEEVVKSALKKWIHKRRDAAKKAQEEQEEAQESQEQTEEIQEAQREQLEMAHNDAALPEAEASVDPTITTEPIQSTSSSVELTEIKLEALGDTTTNAAEQLGTAAAGPPVQGAGAAASGGAGASATATGAGAGAAATGAGAAATGAGAGTAASGGATIVLAAGSMA